VTQIASARAAQVQQAQEMNMESYRGANCVVTGAASGMGEATAQMLVEAGARVHGLDLAPIKTDLASATNCDLSDVDEIERAFAGIDGPIDALFACAGLAQTHPPLRVMAVNYLGTRHVVETAIPRMSDGGALAVISSAAGFAWRPAWPLLKELHKQATIADGLAWCERHADDLGDGYGFSKMALSSWVIWRAPKLAVQGLRLNALCPGMTETPMMPDFEKAVGELLAAFPCPIGRRSNAEEQAHAMLFLNSREAAYLTGIEFFNDGGASAIMNRAVAESMARG
jgi:NAD(P)-dependent dehydrogenase (short-subunit alcohol dehydrogenase family)